MNVKCLIKVLNVHVNFFTLIRNKLLNLLCSDILCVTYLEILSHFYLLHTMCIKHLILSTRSSSKSVFFPFFVLFCCYPETGINCDSQPILFMHTSLSRGAGCDPFPFFSETSTSQACSTPSTSPNDQQPKALGNKALLP